MKTNIVAKLTGALFITSFAVSCSGDKAKEKQKRDVVEQETTATAADSTKIKFEKMKEEYIQHVKEKLIEADRKIDDLNRGIDTAKVKLSAKLKLEMEEWKDRRQKLKETSEKIEKATKENWKNFEKEVKDVLGMKADKDKDSQKNK